ncbi:hypothetical protein [Lactovum miscens]|uniref:Cellobiose-specific phosphotransferase system component IIB n=1 Tax=Lactovum miscens TaxID=190387 RepID=A0A841C583_9LACT|nr:hypothetical protein [Lactovum miscens]MBB5887963.1 cellobiose-specific phosphotransferase system component IIB [Lactovum miscens]
MFIFVGCSGGASSSMFCQRIVKEINENDENMTAAFASIDQVFQKSRAYGSMYDMVFAYGGIDSIHPYNAVEFGELFDVIFVAPQSNYLTATVKEYLKDYPSVVETLPRKLFGMMNGTGAYNILRGMLIELDLWRGYQSPNSTTNKSSDKDLEIFVAGAGHAEPYWQEIFKFLDELEIRTVHQKFSLSELYDYQPIEDFEVRFLFGHMSMLQEKDFSKVARRIDGFLVSPSSLVSLKNRLSWLLDYQIPYQRFDNSDAKKLIKSNDFENEKNKVLDFLQNLELQTGRTSEIFIRKFEEKELPKKKNFWFFSWES